MATYVNDLRLKEIATGDESGTWGASTNTNLELIAEAFSFGTEAITTNADTHTTTIADGSTDPGRSLFLKYTGTLDSACTITIGPNTVSKLWLIENATSGGFSIIIKQGSGATVTVPNGQTKAIYSDGAGSGGAMVDAFTDLSVPSLFVSGDLDVDGTTNLDVVDIDGAVDMASTLTVGGATRINADFSVSAASGEDRFAILPQSAGSGTILFSGNSDLSAYEPLVVDFENLNLRTSGTARFTITASDTVINDNSNDHDFRVESDNNTNMLFVDAGNDRVGVGASTVDEILHVEKASGTTLVKTEVAAGSVVGFEIQKTGATTSNWRIVDGQVANGQFEIFDVTNSRSILNADSSEIVINDTSANLDFRVESDNNANLFTVDAGNDHINIGQNVDYGGTVNIANGDNTAQLVLVSTDTDASEGPILSLYRASASSAADDDITGVVKFQALNDANQATTYAKFLSFIRDASDGSEDGTLQINHIVAGTERVALEFDNDEYVFNNAGIDIDFRVESNGNANMLFVDASTDRVGIGTSGPAAPLSIEGSSTGEFDALILRNSNAASSGQSAAMIFEASSGTSGDEAASVAKISGLRTGSGATGDLLFHTTSSGTSSEAMRITSTGVLQMAGTGTDNDSNAITFVNGACAIARDANDLEIHAFDNLIFGVSNTSYPTSTERMRIQSDGKIRLGNSSDHAMVDVTGSNTAIQLIDNNQSNPPTIRGNGPNFTIENGGHELFKISSTTEVVVNEAGQDTNFRVESNDNTHMLYVDAGSNFVGINASSPNSPLHVQTSHTQTNVTLANTNSTLNIANSGSGDGVFNSIKFSGNQQDMYIMSINDSTQRDRRLGFFVGSVAGDSTGDQHLSITGAGALVTSADNAVSKVTLTGSKSSISDNVATSFAKLIANNNEIHGHLVLKYNLESPGQNIGVGQMTFRVFYNGGTTLLDSISSSTTVFTPTITGTGSGSEFTLKVQMDTATSTYDFEYSLEFLSHNTNVAVANMEEV